jgi:3-deoxy-D-manno-octulosonic-acid transferase
MERATSRVVLYNLVLFLASPLLLAVFLVQAIFAPRVREGHAYRCGLRLPPRPRGTAVWVHAVSVGEVNSVKRLVEMILAADRYDVYLSTTTATGFATAQRVYEDTVTLFYFPLDLRFVIRRVLDVIRPAGVIIAEVEIWPNFLDVARRRHIPVFLVNGRIGARELAGYRRLRWFFGPFYSMYRKVLAQSEDDRARMIEVGMPAQSIAVTRNLKGDFSCSLDGDTAAATRRLIPPGRTVIVAGSTHAPEERHILAACRSLGSGTLFLVIAPRNIDRGEEIRDLCAAHGFSAMLVGEARAGQPMAGRPCNALVVNTMGDLLYFYQSADIVIMGGSFSPSVGGHNILEPLYFGKPVITGPCMQNFLDIDRYYAAQGGICKIDGPEGIGPALQDLIRDAARRRAIGSKGQELLAGGRGGSEETYAAIFGSSGIMDESGTGSVGRQADRHDGPTSQ